MLSCKGKKHVFRMLKSLYSWDGLIVGWVVSSIRGVSYRGKVGEKSSKFIIIKRVTFDLKRNVFEKMIYILYKNVPTNTCLVTDIWLTSVGLTEILR